MLALLAAVLSLVAALVPGTIATSVLTALNSGGVTEPIGVARDPDGRRRLVGRLHRRGVPDRRSRRLGIRDACRVVADVVAISAGRVRRRTVLASPASASPGRSGRLRVRASAWLRQVDDWLVVQPQLVVVFGGAVLGLVLTQFIH